LEVFRTGRLNQTEYHVKVIR